MISFLFGQFQSALYTAFIFLVHIWEIAIAFLSISNIFRIIVYVW